MLTSSDIQTIKDMARANRETHARVVNVRFLNSKGENVRIEDGATKRRGTNVIHQVFYWGVFTREQATRLASELGIKAVISEIEENENE